MNFLIYIIIFLAGAFFGSFFTLAVYRIPKNEDILIKHSYCPNCNHKLGFFDLFPIFSYILLKGKCRYCGNKIRARYLILEILSGFTFVLVSISLRYNFINIMTNEIIYLIFSLLYISILFIIAGIDKENIDINESTLYIGFMIEILYIIYICTLNNVNVYQYVIYSILFLLILILYLILNNTKYRKLYLVKILLVSVFMFIYSGIYIFTITVIISVIIVILNKFIIKYKKIPIGFYIVISNIVTIVLYNTITNYII